LTVKEPYADGRLVVLTTSGGGMRASAFTLGVLAELDELEDVGRGTAFDEIDLISSVSGGSWAVAAVLADRASGPAQRLAERMPYIEGRYAQLAHATVRNWAQSFIPSVTNNLTYAQVYRAGAKSPLPFTYFNSTLYPSQSPFVFTPAYLSYYRVTALGDPAAPRRVIVQEHDLANIPIGYAASASGAVPGYTSAFAETDLCWADGAPSYCFPKRKGGVRDNLQLMDGGLYDNIGYKTAIEIGLADRDRIARHPATIIMIDTADTEDFQTMPRKGRDAGHPLSLLLASTFPNQNATFDRLRDPALSAAGFDRRILLDFGSTAYFDTGRDGRELEGLPELAYFAVHDVSCYRDNGSIFAGSKRMVAPADPGRWQDNLERLKIKGRDCAAMNFARVGYLHKTTFKYDAYAFQLRYQLGRLAVRMHRRDIGEAVFRTGRNPTRRP
jgi:predicted acylesterase/phospholipase RssA